MTTCTWEKIVRKMVVIFDADKVKENEDGVSRKAGESLDQDVL